MTGIFIKNKKNLYEMEEKLFDSMMEEGQETALINYAKRAIENYCDEKGYEKPYDYVVEILDGQILFDINTPDGMKYIEDIKKEDSFAAYRFISNFENLQQYANISIEDMIKKQTPHSVDQIKAMIKGKSLDERSNILMEELRKHAKSIPVSIQSFSFKPRLVGMKLLAPIYSGYREVADGTNFDVGSRHLRTDELIRKYPYLEEIIEIAELFVSAPEDYAREVEGVKKEVLGKLPKDLENLIRKY